MLDHEGFDRRAAEALVQRGPDHHSVGTFAGGDVDLLAVEHVVIAVLDRCGADRRRVRAATRFGNRHGGPGAAEARQLLIVGHCGNRRVAQALARHGQQQADIAPAQLHYAEQGRHIAAVLDPFLLLAGRATLARRGGTDGIRRAGVHAIEQLRQQIQLLWVGVLGLVVLARKRAEIIFRHLMGLINQATEFLRGF